MPEIWRANRRVSEADQVACEAPDPAHCATPDGHWFGLTCASTIAVLDGAREAAELSTYAASR